MEALKLCPICGGEPEFQHFSITPNVRGRIICSCGLEIMQGANETEDDLRIIWNTRASEGTRWYELFGTPERAARTMMRYLVNGCDGVECMDGCPFYDATTPTHCAITSTSETALLEWLRGDAE